MANFPKLPPTKVLRRVMPNDYMYGDVRGYTADQMREYAIAARAALQPAQTAPQWGREFIEACANTSGGMVSGNRLSMRAKELLASQFTAPQHSPLTDAELSNPEYMRGYVEELHAAIGELAARPQPTATVASGDAVSDEPVIVEAITRLERLHSTKEERFAAADGLRALLSHPAAPAQPQLRPFQCWSNDDGDRWFERPGDIEFINGAKVGDTYELLAGWNSVRATYRVTKAPDDESDDYEVECVSHPTENAPAQPQGFDAEFLSKRLARVAKLAGVPMPAMSHEHVAECAGTILGKIARKLEAALSAPAAQQPTPAVSEVNAQPITIDSEEFSSLLCQYGDVARAEYGTVDEWQAARDVLVAHIDARLAALSAPAMQQPSKRELELEAARIAYASEFPPNADGEPDVGNIHANIRKLKAQIAQQPSDRDKLLRIIACAYQIAGVHDAPEHILDVLSDPENATDEQIDAMLPYQILEQPSETAIWNAAIEAAANVCEGRADEWLQKWEDVREAYCEGAFDAYETASLNIRSLLRPAAQEADRLPGAVDLLVRAGHSPEEARELINETAVQEAEKLQDEQASYDRYIIETYGGLTEYAKRHTEASARYERKGFTAGWEAAREQPAKGNAK